MVVIEREVQHVYPDKWEELEAIDKEFNKVEAKYGLPPKKRYQMFSGADVLDTLIVEYQWESLAAMETAYTKLMVDPEWQALGKRVNKVVKDIRIELFMPLP